MADLVKSKNNQVSTVEEVSIDNRFQIIEEIVRKDYLSRINDMYIAENGQLIDIEDDIISNIRLYKVTEMVYQKGELATDKFTTVFNTLSTYSSNVFILMVSDGKKTDYYVGVRNMEDGEMKRSTVTIGDTVKNTLIGHFPGIKIENEDRTKIKDISSLIERQSNVASVSVLGSSKVDKVESNEQFVQGLEKLAYAMNGRQYIGLIIAQSQSPEDVREIRSEYQQLHTNLFPYKSYQSSIAETESTSRKKKFSEMNKEQKSATVIEAVATTVGSIAGGVVAGVAVGAVTYGTGAIPAGAAGVMIGGTIASVACKGVTKAVNFISPKETITKGKTTTEIRIYENKEVVDLIDLIDKGIERTKEFDSYGMWNVASYFLSEDMSTAEIAASNYRSLMNGENSGNEVSAINSWRKDDKKVYGNFDDLTKYLSRFVHPIFCYGRKDDYNLYTTATTVVSGKELGLHLGLPRKTVPGLPVIEHAEFGKEVISSSMSNSIEELNPEDRMLLGKVYDLGKKTDKDVELKNDDLTMHTFITGSTGSGKSNTVYQVINELIQDKIPFLVIEPAKGEYKDVFGNREDVNVYSTNPNIAELININPFMFPESIHVLEHVDGLVEIFGVCWPMYDAMPAFFKDAILKSYEYVGWDLGTSRFFGEKVEYPDFEILAEMLDRLIDESGYASDIKSNYRGALLTRVKSLTVGLNKYIFTQTQTPYKKLFDENCILDLSRVKSTETRSLLMGLMVYILNEYRVDKKTGSNSKLKHITILEEAHNLLKNTSNNESELVGKSVEMLTQTIAEIRTYGEGFVIVDQSPTSVDIAAIKNTNTKIVLRTPEANDREAVGKSIGLDDNQINEIAKLPTGIAVVYQNSWVTPVLVYIDEVKTKKEKYISNYVSDIISERMARSILTTVILSQWVERTVANNKRLMQSLNVLNLPRTTKKEIESIISVFEENDRKISWTEEEYGDINELLLAIMNLSDEKIAKLGNADNLRKYICELTDGFSIDDIEIIGFFLSYKKGE